MINVRVELFEVDINGQAFHLTESELKELQEKIALILDSSVQSVTIDSPPTITHEPNRTGDSYWRIPPIWTGGDFETTYVFEYDGVTWPCPA